jgi:hypothetical protein
MSVTLLEDILAVVLLTLISSVARMRLEPHTDLWKNGFAAPGRMQSGPD